MRFVTLSIVAILVLMLQHTEARNRNKVCYAARTCIHKGDEKCGVDKGGDVRRFFDSCDILEFNCLYNTAFIKTTLQRCKNLPPIEYDEEKMKRAQTQKP